MLPETIPFIAELMEDDNIHGRQRLFVAMDSEWLLMCFLV